MNRLLAPAAAAALLAGCALPDIPGLLSEEPLDIDSAPVAVAVETTYIVEEVPVEVPVYHTETVYYEEDPAPAETVCVVEEYESYIFVSEPPRPHRGHTYRPPGGRGRRGSEPPKREPPKREPPKREPPERKPKPNTPPAVEADPVPPRIRPEPVRSEPPSPPPPPPPKPAVAPVTDDEEEAPDRPTPPDQSVSPESHAPAKDGDVSSAPVESVKPTPGPAAEDGDEVADAGSSTKVRGKTKER